MEQFYCKTKILAGRGAVAALKDFGIRRLLVVTDPYFVENGIAAQVAAQAQAEAVEIFPEVRPDPAVTLAARGTAVVNEFAPDTVVALGGGSAMDCAKAMVYFAGKSIRLIAIPTTSGSGSEVTDFAILTHDGVKHPLVDPGLRPEAAILDDALLEKLPRGLIADSGFDVIAHAVESYCATGAGAITDALARDAFCTAFDALPDSYHGDTSVRLRLHTAATMAGMAFTQAGLGLCHAMSHALGGQFHLPHGRLNAILLPEVVRCNSASAMKKYAALARSAGLGGSADTLAVRSLRNALIQLRKVLDLPGTLAQAGVDSAQVCRHRASLISAILADPCCVTNPAPVDAGMVAQVLEAVTGNG